MNPSNIELSEETGIIIQIGFEVLNELGPGFLEIVYKDAFEMELRDRGIPFEREKCFEIMYKGFLLKRRFFADFLVFDQVILEVKANEGGISEPELAQTINYLKASGCKVGLILNFSRMKLQIKRVIY